MTEPLCKVGKGKEPLESCLSVSQSEEKARLSFHAQGPKPPFATPTLTLVKSCRPEPAGKKQRGPAQECM